MAAEIWVSIGSGNGLLPDCTKSLITRTNVDSSSKVLCGINLRLISHEVLMNLIYKMCLEITLVKWIPHDSIRYQWVRSLPIAGSTALDFTCEPDEYSLLVQDLKASGIIKDHRKGLKTYKNSFTGKDFVNWVTKTKGLGRWNFFAVFFS